jgi:Ca2+/Na+ antiporter
MAGYSILSITGAVVVPGLYVCSLVAIIKSHARDRAIECAGVMLIVFFVLMAALSVPNIPSWVPPSLGFLVLLLSLSTLFFLLKRAADGRGRKQVVRLKGFSLFQRPTQIRKSSSCGRGTQR